MLSIMTTATTAANLDKYGEDDIFSTLLRYGLFIGAIFQLICIGASILLPVNNDSHNSVDGEEAKPGIDGGANARRQHKFRKLEKKKRR